MAKVTSDCRLFLEGLVRWSIQDYCFFDVIILSRLNGSITVELYKILLHSLLSFPQLSHLYHVNVDLK